MVATASLNEVTPDTDGRGVPLPIWCEVGGAVGNDILRRPHGVVWRPGPPRQRGARVSPALTPRRGPPLAVPGPPPALLREGEPPPPCPEGGLARRSEVGDTTHVAAAPRPRPVAVGLQGGALGKGDEEGGIVIRFVLYFYVWIDIPREREEEEEERRTPPFLCVPPLLCY